MKKDKTCAPNSAFCIIGQNHDGRYVRLSGDRLSIRQAREMRKGLGEPYRDIKIVPVQVLESVLMALNGEVVPPEMDMLAIDLENKIRSAIIMHDMFAHGGKHRKVKEIFIGHENYEVEVTWHD